MAKETKPNKNGKQVRAYIGLGSNQGDRIGYVQQAMQLLKDVPRLEIVECSSLYETEPIGQKKANWFVNAVTAIDTDLTTEELLEVCLDIESRLAEFQVSDSANEDVSAFKGGRIIDLDILFYGDEIIDSDHLKIPHPNLHLRAFALVPLMEIAPDFVHPTLGQSICEMHELLEEPEMIYLYGTRGLEEEFF